MDIIRMTDLTLDCLIGVYAHERLQRQSLVINITLEADLYPGIITDCIEDTLSYEQIYDDVCALAKHSSYYLIEALAQAIAAACLMYPRVKSARVRIDKPRIFKQVHSAGVEILRVRGAEQSETVKAPLLNHRDRSG